MADKLIPDSFIKDIQEEVNIMKRDYIMESAMQVKLELQKTDINSQPATIKILEDDAEIKFKGKTILLSQWKSIQSFDEINNSNKPKTKEVNNGTIR